MGTHLREQLMTARVSYRVELLIREAAPPEGEVAVEWILVTTPPIGTPEEMRRVVEYYCVRWAIGVFFRTLKSGCRIGERRFEDAERVLPRLALCLIVAWRTMHVSPGSGVPGRGLRVRIRGVGV